MLLLLLTCLLTPSLTWRVLAANNANFYNSFWTDNKTSVAYKNLAGGAYSVEWGGNGNFVAGKGQKPGSSNSSV
jgi:hypothetical protein